MSSSSSLNDPLEYSNNFSQLHGDKLKRAELKHVAELLRGYDSSTLTLDYGCGAGRSARFLKSFGLDVEAVDINQHIIRAAQEIDPLGKYELIESGRIHRSDNYYDLVHCSWVLVHVATKEELLRICREIVRVLKPNGTFILVVNSDEMYNNRDWSSCHTMFEENKNLYSGCVAKVLFKANNLVIYDYYWTEKDYSEILSEAQLKIVCKLKPLASIEDDCTWKDEIYTSRSVVYVTQKLECAN